jgi:hypothetical protein
MTFFRSDMTFFPLLCQVKDKLRSYFISNVFHSGGNVLRHQSCPLSYDFQLHPSPSLDVENQSQQHVLLHQHCIPNHQLSPFIFDLPQGRNMIVYKAPPQDQSIHQSMLRRLYFDQSGVRQVRYLHYIALNSPRNQRDSRRCVLEIGWLLRYLIISQLLEFGRGRKRTYDMSRSMVISTGSRIRMGARRHCLSDYTPDRKFSRLTARNQN